MAIQTKYRFERWRGESGEILQENTIHLPCGPAGLSNVIPYDTPYGVTGFVQVVLSDNATERWEITAPDLASGRNGAVLYKIVMRVYGKPAPPFFALVMCDPLGEHPTSAKVVSEEEADTLRRSASVVQLEDYAGKLSAQRYKILSLLWKAKGHKMSLDTIAAKLWGRKNVSESDKRTAIDRLRKDLLRLDSPVSITTKDRHAILELFDK